MSTAIYLTLTSSDFPQAMTYVRAASHTSKRIHDLVHPHLRQDKGEIHKQILAASYSDITDDIVYTILTQYRNYLLYERLSPEKRFYNTMYIISALRHDVRLRPGIKYVESTL